MITLTDKAARHVSHYLICCDKGVGLHVGARTTGCSGLAYKLEYVDEIATEDQVFEFNGIKVIINPKSLSYVDGTELGYARKGLSGKFRFNNPDAKGRCDCGESLRA